MQLASNLYCVHSPAKLEKVEGMLMLYMPYFLGHWPRIFGRTGLCSYESEFGWIMTNHSFIHCQTYPKLFSPILYISTLAFYIVQGGVGGGFQSCFVRGCTEEPNFVRITNMFHDDRFWITTNTSKEKLTYKKNVTALSAVSKNGFRCIDAVT